MKWKCISEDYVHRKNKTSTLPVVILDKWDMVRIIGDSIFNSYKNSFLIFFNFLLNFGSI